MCLINRSEAKKRILQVCEDLCPAKGITRVSKEALDDLEDYLYSRIVELVNIHPSKGVTFRTR